MQTATTAERGTKRLTKDAWLAEPEHPEPAFTEATRYIDPPASVTRALANAGFIPRRPGGAPRPPS